MCERSLPRNSYLRVCRKSELNTLFRLKNNLLHEDLSQKTEVAGSSRNKAGHRTAEDAVALEDQLSGN